MLSRSDCGHGASLIYFLVSIYCEVTLNNFLFFIFNILYI
jgi:hypothetical protein